MRCLNKHFLYVTYSYMKDASLDRATAGYRTENSPLELNFAEKQLQ